MKCYTVNRINVREGITVLRGEDESQLAARLGDAQNRVLVPTSSERPPESQPCDHFWAFSGPKPEARLIRESAIRRVGPRVEFYESVGDSDSALVRIDSEGSFSRGRSGEAKELWGEPQMIVRAISSDRMGFWDDALWMMPRESALYVHFRGRTIDPIVVHWDGSSLKSWKPERWRQEWVVSWMLGTTSERIESERRLAEERGNAKLAELLATPMESRIVG